MAKNNAKIIDPNMLIAAGIDPKTGLPIKLADKDVGAGLFQGIYRRLEIIDEQDAINRFTWYDLPEGLTPQLIERVLYYRGQGALFKLQDKFYFLPYALNGTIDVYGRYTGITPLPFNGTANDGDPEKPWIQGLTFKPEYGWPIPEDFAGKSREQIEQYLDESCVILQDYSPAISQYVVPNANLQAPILSLMSACLPYMRTAMLNSTGVMGMKVANANDVPEVERASSAINRAALNGDKYVPLLGSVDFQELTGGNVGKAEEFLLALQSLDNFRLSMYGLDNGGLFQKRSHMLEAEQEMNTGNAGLVLDDSLNLRQDFCARANMIWGTEMWCEVSETVLGIDRDGDGEAAGGSGEYSQGGNPTPEDTDQEETNE